MNVAQPQPDGILEHTVVAGLRVMTGLSELFKEHTFTGHEGIVGLRHLGHSISAVLFDRQGSPLYDETIRYSYENLQHYIGAIDGVRVFTLTDDFKVKVRKTDRSVFISLVPAV